MPLKTCFWHLSGPFGAKFSVLCFGWGLIFHSHLWTLWTRLSVDYGCSYLLSPRQHRSTTGLCVEPHPHPHLRLNLKHSHVSLITLVRVSPGGGLPSTSGPAVSEMMIVLLRDLLPDLQQDINHHLVMHHSPSCGCRALGESVSDKGHRSDPAWDRQPSLVDQFLQDRRTIIVHDPEQLSLSRSCRLQTQKQPVKPCLVHDVLLTSALNNASVSELSGSHRGRSRVALVPRVKL